MRSYIKRLVALAMVKIIKKHVADNGGQYSAREEDTIRFLSTKFIWTK